jgi:hypothetical protein
MIQPEDIRPLTDFQRNAKTHIRRLKRSRRPGLLTINGRAAVVVQDARAYQKLLDRLTEVEEAQAIQEAVPELQAGKGRPYRNVMRDFRARFGSAGRRRKSA